MVGCVAQTMAPTAAGAAAESEAEGEEAPTNFQQAPIESWAGWPTAFGPTRTWASWAKPRLLSPRAVLPNERTNPCRERLRPFRFRETKRNGSGRLRRRNALAFRSPEAGALTSSSANGFLNRVEQLGEPLDTVVLLLIVTVEVSIFSVLVWGHFHLHSVLFLFDFIQP